MYGGQQSETGMSSASQSEMGQVYILTLPAFRWINTNISTIFRDAHQCEVVGNRQMLSIGGMRGWVGTPDNRTMADAWPNGLGVFDMTDLRWTNAYDATAKPYVPSKPVSDFYAKGARYPTWSNNELAKIFTVNTTSAASTGTTTAPAANPTGTTTALAGSPTGTAATATGTTATGTTATGTTAESGNGNGKMGTIVGGSIGGAVGICILASVLYWCLRRKAKTDREQQSIMLDIQQPAYVYTAEMPAAASSTELWDSKSGAHEVGTKEMPAVTYPAELWDSKSGVHEVGAGKMPPAAYVAELWDSKSGAHEVGTRDEPVEMPASPVRKKALE
jgi:hypothetical protein